MHIRNLKTSNTVESGARAPVLAADWTHAQFMAMTSNPHHSTPGNKIKTLLRMPNDSKLIAPTPFRSSI